MLLPEIERQQKAGKEVVFRADAAFAKPEIYEAPAIRIASNDSLERELLTAGRQTELQAGVRYKGFQYEAASWKTARRVVAKGEFHFGELFPWVGFIVSNLETDKSFIKTLKVEAAFRSGLESPASAICERPGPGDRDRLLLAS
jgi:hypothetical protein